MLRKFPKVILLPTALLALASCTTMVPISSNEEGWSYSGIDPQTGVSVAVSTNGTKVATVPSLGTMTYYANGDFVEFPQKGGRIYGHVDYTTPDTATWWCYDRFGQFHRGVGLMSLAQIETR